MQKETLMDSFSEVLRGVLKSNDTKQISGENFYIGDGIIRWDNFFVPLDHVVLVAKYQKQKEISRFALLAVGFGIFLFLFALLLISISLEMFISVFTLSLTFLFIGGGVLYYELLHKKRPYYVRIKLSSGDQFYVMNTEEEFIDKVIDVIECCINGKRFI